MIWKSNTHQFSATVCQRTGKTCPALARMARALVQSISTAGSATTRELEIEGSAELTHCPGGCTARFRAQPDEIRIFCGTLPNSDIDKLDDYANLMFGTAPGALPSGAITDPPCAMLQALACEPTRSATADARASA
ncbi:MAG: hypothetical protein AB3N07_02520 [Ruegeria sp.]